MKWLLKLLIIVLLPIGIVACGTNENDNTGGNQGTEENVESGDNRDVTITLGLTNWTSTIPPTYIAKQILEDLGYTVELQAADVGPIYTGVSRGDIDVFMDAWLPDMHANYMEKFGDDIEDVAVSYTEGEMGWVVPSYVEGIETVSDLKGNEDMFGGNVYGIEEGAGMTGSAREMIESYDLDLTYVASSEAGMLSEARRYMANEEPVLFLGWRPHPMFVDWDLRVLEEDEEVLHPTSEVHIVTNANFSEKAPEVYEFLSNWSIDVNDVEQMIIKIEEGESEEEVAREWVEENQDKIDEMLAGTAEE